MGFAKLHFEPGRIRNNSFRLCINAYLRAELDPNLVQPNVAGAGIPSNGKDDRVELVRVARSVVVLSGSDGGTIFFGAKEPGPRVQLR